MELEPIGATPVIEHYSQGQTQRLNQSSQSGKLLKRKPVVIPEEMPQTTVKRVLRDNEDYKSVVGLLTTYYRQGSGRQWDEYEKKWPVQLLKLWHELLIETRRNGFIPTGADGKEILWCQVISKDNKVQDQCYMCDRPCKYRDDINSGRARVERQLNKDNPNWHPAKPCWEGPH
jgi:hypothetical protein